MKLYFKKYIVLSLFVFAGAAVALVYQLFLQPATDEQVLTAPSQHSVQTSTLVKAAEPTVQTQDVHSGDGTVKLIMKAQTAKDGTANYTFTASEISGNNSHIILSKALGANESMSIPYNTWSPDNKLVFIQYTNGSTTEYYVMKGSGEPWPNGEQYFTLRVEFEKRDGGLSVREATGWASNTLVVFTTVKADGNRGPNYWFEVPSKAFIQLAH